MIHQDYNKRTQARYNALSKEQQEAIDGIADNFNKDVRERQLLRGNKQSFGRLQALQVIFAIADHLQ